MIGVRVGKEYRVEPPEAHTQGLLPEIGRGVNDDLLLALLYQHRSPQALIARIV
jgi:hypothetical protein